MNCPFAPILPEASSKPSFTACQNELVVDEWQVKTMFNVLSANAGSAMINNHASMPSLRARFSRLFLSISNLSARIILTRGRQFRRFETARLAARQTRIVQFTGGGTKFPRKVIRCQFK